MLRALRWSGPVSHSAIVTQAPQDDEATDYDRQHLPLYAALLDAEVAGQRWQDVAATLMRIDVTAPFAEACWRSHLERARWIVGDGLSAAITRFGTVRTSN